MAKKTDSQKELQLPPLGDGWDESTILKNLDGALRQGDVSLREIARQNGMTNSRGVEQRLKSYGAGVKILTYLYDLKTGKPIRPVTEEDLVVKK